MSIKSMPQSPEYAAGWDRLKWGVDPAAEEPPKSVRRCMNCHGNKPMSNWCEKCQTNTPTERIYF